MRLHTVIPQPGGFRQTAIRDRSTGYRIGSPPGIWSGRLPPTNICDCFRSRWFRFPENQPGCQQQECSRFADTRNEDASRHCASPRLTAGFMFKMPEVEVGAEFAVDSDQKVHVERSRNAEFIVVCGESVEKVAFRDRFRAKGNRRAGEFGGSV